MKLLTKLGFGFLALSALLPILLPQIIIFFQLLPYTGPIYRNWPTYSGITFVIAVGLFITSAIRWKNKMDSAFDKKTKRKIRLVIPQIRLVSQFQRCLTEQLQ